MRTFTDIDQLAAAVGADLGTSDRFEIDQDRINLFADATDDHQWIHVDEERAAQGPFGGTIAHGYMTVSLIPALSKTIFSIETDGPRLNYGLNKVRFPNPVRVGSRVRTGHPRRTRGRARRQAARRPLHDRDRGRGEAGLRGRDRGAAARLGARTGSGSAAPGLASAP